MFTNKSNFIFRIFLATLGLILSFQASAERGNSNQKFSSKSFMIVFACEDSNGSGIDIGLSQTLMSTLQNNSSAFSSVMTTSTYMKYCKPYSLNMTNLELLKNGTLYGQADGKEYILIKQGPTATFGVIGR